MLVSVQRICLTLGGKSALRELELEASHAVETIFSLVKEKMVVSAKAETHF